jgi:hypothetical protein
MATPRGRSGRPRVRLLIEEIEKVWAGEMTWRSISRDIRRSSTQNVMEGVVAPHSGTLNHLSPWDGASRPVPALAGEGEMVMHARVPENACSRRVTHADPCQCMRMKRRAYVRRKVVPCCFVLPILS